MKIYTRTGDKGTTGLYGGRRVSKDDIRVEAYGTVDELNSAIGLAIAAISRQSSDIRRELVKIQGDLFEIGAVLASPNAKYKILNTKYLSGRVTEFEQTIDKLTDKLPELRNFILPGGSQTGATLHLARSISRRAERRVVTLAKKEAVNREVIKYMNRLSDLLFTMARFVNRQKHIPETPWKGLR